MPKTAKQPKERLVRISVQMTAENHTRLQDRAIENNRSTSAEANHRLIKSMDAEGRKKK